MGERAAGEPDWPAALATLGQVFHIEAMTFKNHACCGHTFAAIDGALALKQQMGITADDIARVQVATYRPALDVAGNVTPRTRGRGPLQPVLCRRHRTALRPCAPGGVHGRAG